MPSFTDYIRFAPATRLAGRLRRRLNGLAIWVLKTAVRHLSRRKSQSRSRQNPAAWRTIWDNQEAAGWPRLPVTGIVEAAGVKLVIDRSEITPEGHLWVDGWMLGPGSVKLEAAGCAIQWQETFATSRSDVVETLKLSRTGRDGQIGFQILAFVADHEPGRSRLALVTGSDSGDAGLVVPVVPEVERSGDLWQTVYDAMRYRGPRDAAYLETSVGLLKHLRKADWRERTQSIGRAIDAGLSGDAGLKILLLSRFHANAAYLNLTLLAAALGDAAEFVVCSMGQQAIRRANEYRDHFASLGEHRVTFVNGEVTTPSSEVIERFAAACQARRCRALIVHDDVVVASAMTSLASALRQGAGGGSIAWRRRFPETGPETLAFARPLEAHDSLGPYWRHTAAMKQQALGAVLFDAGGIDVPAIPAFEGRGCALEYLVDNVLPGATIAEETMLDLVDPATQREAHTLDMLMLLAHRKAPAA